MYFDCLANYNTREAFTIIFFICSDLLNCLRSVDTIVIKTKRGWNIFKDIFTKQFLTKATIFSWFDVFSLRPPHLLQVQAKISTIQPVFPDYHSGSYEYVISKTCISTSNQLIALKKLKTFLGFKGKVFQSILSSFYQILVIVHLFGSPRQLNHQLK